MALIVRARRLISQPASRQFILVVVTQMPDDVDHLVRALIPMVRNARDASPGGPVGLRRVVYLTDDRMFGARDLGYGSHSQRDCRPAPVRTDGLQCRWRLGHRQLSRIREKHCH